MATTYLTRTMSTNSNQRTFTFSCWVKRSKLGSTQYLLGVGGGGAYASALYFMSSDEIEVWNYFNSSYAGRYRTSAKYRDVNAWYHIVMAIDTTQSTDTDRFKLYVNGELITAYAVRNNTSQNQTWEFNSASVHEIGRNASNPFDGSMSHVHFCDGQQLAPTVFGSTDSTTGEWKINADPTFTPGTNGFTILKDGNTITDQSANSNNFTVGAGTLTKTEDNPSNVFATLNPLVPYDGALAYTKGNTVVAYSGSGGDSWTTRWGVSTLGMTAGKYYAEAKIAAIGTNQMYALGIVKDVGTFTPTSSVGTDGVGYYSNGGIFKLSNQTQTVASYTTNDIIGIAFDRDNGTVQWYKNGSTVGSAETGLSTDGTWFFVSNFYSSGKVAVNFGNGYFEETAVSSAGTNASGNGIFEYNVPTGYTALSTKGLNE